MKYGRNLLFFCCFFTTFALVEANMRRHISAWLLLAVFLPMLILSSTHIHNRGNAAEEECKQCVHHKVHSSHLSQAQAKICDCLLCQIQHLTFLSATPLAATIPCPLLYALPDDQGQQAVTGVLLINASRAPPFV